jgi:hypothetical protein
MKKSFLLACSSLVLLFASCSKKSDPTPEPVGEAKVRYINAVQASLAQDLYLNGAKISSLPVTYGNVSDYLTITSGVSRFAFYNTGTNTSNTTGDFPIRMGEKWSIFYYKNSEDKLTAGSINDASLVPPTGKAYVRFIHLNGFLRTIPVAIKVSGSATALITSLDYQTVSPYKEVEPGAKFTFEATGVTVGPELNGGIEAGKSYTVWIDGSSAASLTGHVVVHN